MGGGNPKKEKYRAKRESKKRFRCKKDIAAGRIVSLRMGKTGDECWNKGPRTDGAYRQGQRGGGGGVNCFKTCRKQVWGTTSQRG